MHGRPVVWNLRTSEHDPEESIVSAHYTCDNCHRPSLGFDYTCEDQYGTTAESWLYRYSEEIRWYPTGGETRKFQDVPEAIASAAAEAHLCHSANAHRAALILARAVVEATAKEKDCQRRNLFEMIEALEVAKHVRGYVKEAAHAIRDLGNNMAHGDFEEVSAADCALVLTLMDEVLLEVYQSPASVAKAQVLREEAKRRSARRVAPPATTAG